MDLSPGSIFGFFFVDPPGSGSVIFDETDAVGDFEFNGVNGIDLDGGHPYCPRSMPVPWI